MMKKIEDLNFYELLEISPTANAQDIHRAYERVRRVYEPNSIALYSLFTTDETAAIHQRVEEAYRTLIYEDNRRKYDAMLRERNEIPDLPTPPMQKPYQSRPVQPATPMQKTYQSLPVEQAPSLPMEISYPAADEGPQPAPPAPKPQPEDIASMSQFIGEFTGAAIKALREQLGQDLRAIADQTKVSMRFLEYIEQEEYQKLPARAYVRGFLALYAKALGCDQERMVGDYLKRYDAVTGFPHNLRKKSAG